MVKFVTKCCHTLFMHFGLLRADGRPSFSASPQEPHWRVLKVTNNPRDGVRIADQCEVPVIIDPINRVRHSALHGARSTTASVGCQPIVMGRSVARPGGPWNAQRKYWE